MKSIVYLLSISVLICFTFAFVLGGNVQKALFQNAAISSSELCSTYAAILKFCTETDKIFVKVREPIVLKFSLRNISDSEILVKTNRDLSRFIVKVTDGHEKRMLTKIEQNMKREVVSADHTEDFVDALTRSHRSEVLGSKRVLHEKLLISDTYDFSEVGIHYVEVLRHTLNPKGEGFIEIPLEKIRIEVRD